MGEEDGRRDVKRRKIIIDVCAKPKGEPVCPPHGMVLRGVCTRCRQQVEDDSSFIPFGYIDKDFKIAGWKVDMIRKSNTNSLLRQKKLSLILDLDHTLLHSRSIEKVRKRERDVLGMAAEQSRVDDPDSRSLFIVDSVQKLTKLRPFVRTFLREANSMFCMHLYTMGSREYALEMAKLLDPNGEFFNLGVIAREDCTMPNQKGLDVVMGEERTVVIVDDKKEVWERHQANLVQIDRYHFFGSRRRREESERDDDDDDALARTLCVLKKIHQMFYSPATTDAELYSRDTREVLKKIRHDDDKTGERSNRPRMICRLRIPPSMTNNPLMSVAPSAY